MLRSRTSEWCEKELCYANLLTQARDTSFLVKSICAKFLEIMYTSADAIEEAECLIQEGTSLIDALTQQTSYSFECYSTCYFRFCPFLSFSFINRSYAEAQFLQDLFILFGDLDLKNDYELCFFIDSVRIVNNVIDRIVNELRIAVDNLYTEGGNCA